MRIEIDRRIIILSLLTAIAWIGGETTVLGQRMSQSAAEQIAAISEAKKRRTPIENKIESNLLLETRRRGGRAPGGAFASLRTANLVGLDGSVELDISAAVSDELLARIGELGGTIVSSFQRYGAIRANVPANQIEALASEPAVRSIRPAERPITNKNTTSEGDAAHGTDTARTAFGVDGTGVSIGVMSDGVDSLADRQASGDLPPVVTVQDAGMGEEGTAMLEIVFDLAPGAALFYHQAFDGQAAFADGIRQLQMAGCQVIVDDIFYFGEPVFEDGVIALAVNEVAALGVSYFSSAGNAGNLNDGRSGVWEGDFRAASALPPAITDGMFAHDWTGGDVTLNPLTAEAPFGVGLQWADPFGGATADYDLFILNAAGDTVVGASTNPQTGTQNPFEFFDTSAGGFAGAQVAVVLFSGASDRFIHMNTFRGQLTHATTGQTSGHPSAAGAFAVSAVDVALAAGGTFDSADTVEAFTSDGPRRVFYDPPGVEITPGNLTSTGGVIRNKPDITAADGVMTDAPGFNPFFGTSAAAPHAAAIAALLIQQGNATTPAQIRTALTTTAIDIEAPGYDRDSGFGIIDPNAALASTTGGTPTPTPTPTGTPTPTPTPTSTPTPTPTPGPAPDAPDGELVIGYVVANPIAPGSGPMYTYSWASENGDGVVHGPKPESSDLLTETGLVDVGEEWTVSVTVSVGGMQSVAATARFELVNSSGVVKWTFYE